LRYKLAVMIIIATFGVSCTKKDKEVKNAVTTSETISSYKDGIWVRVDTGKSYFLSNISHELRTPLNSIMNVTETISSEATDEKLLQNCALIQYSSKSLLNSVNDILDF